MERKKGGKEEEEEREIVRERERDGGVSGWEKEGDWKRERERWGEYENREGKEKMEDVPNCMPSMNVNTYFSIQCTSYRKICTNIFLTMTMKISNIRLLYLF